MRSNELNVIAKISSAGQLKVLGEMELRKFLSDNKGKSIAVSFSVIENETSPRLIGYYYKYIVPRIKCGLLTIGEQLTEKETDMYLRKIAPMTQRQRYDFAQKKYKIDVLDVENLGNFVLQSFCEWCKMFAAENLNVILDDPNPIMRDNEILH